MSPATRVSASRCRAIWTLEMSPFPITGTDTEPATSAMIAQSAGPEYPCSFVRPWTAIL